MRMTGHFIGGRISSPIGTGSIEVVDPATAIRITEIPAAAKADVDAAVHAARACFDERSWRKLSPADRAAAMWTLSDKLLSHAEELAEIETRDNGMPIGYARALVTSAVNGIRYYAGMVTKIYGQTSEISAPERNMLAYSLREPVGVVGAITPWNAPLWTLLTKIAPAIAAGCSVVAKPAEQTPLSAQRLGELLAEWRIFPDGLINIVNGYGSEAGAALSEHPDVDKITFTGSTAVGKQLVRNAAATLKRTTLELGGKSPVFVFDDADLDKAIPVAAAAIFANAGQVCFAGSRLYVQRGIFDRVAKELSGIGDAIRLGNGLDAATQMGPLVSERQMRRVLDYIELGIGEGAELVSGGSRYGEDGYFVRPTVLANKSGRSMRIVDEEIFGPVLVMMPFETMDDVERLANATSYGLGSGIFTNSISTANRAAKLIRSGNVWINCYGILDRSLPFGGMRQSGWGRENGQEGIDAFLETKAVYTML